LKGSGQFFLGQKVEFPQLRRLTGLTRLAQLGLSADGGLALLFDGDLRNFEIVHNLGYQTLIGTKKNNR
jgi:hypothetical protein